MYKLLTPGPITTTQSVKSTMLQDWSTWDCDYNDIVQAIRRELVRLATPAPGYTSVLMQGSGTAAVESVIGTTLGANDKLLILANGAYGERIEEIARYLRIPHSTLNFSELGAIDTTRVNEALSDDSEISHVAMVHCETTTGRLNDLHAVSTIVEKHQRLFIVDAMSSFGGIPIDMGALGIDFLISSANKCIQGVPGFGFICAKTTEMEKLEGRARSLSLDMYQQWRTMEEHGGKWRFTSPTHVVRAFHRALEELGEEGGIGARHRRYLENHRVLVEGMRNLGFKTLLEDRYHSPIITTFLYPEHPAFSFSRFYDLLKKNGFVIYPGKVTDADCFRIGTIGDLNKQDVETLLKRIGDNMYWTAEPDRQRA